MRADEIGEVEYASNEDVMQDETLSLTTVPVSVEGPVQVRELPALAGGWGTVAATTSSSRLLSADPRRKTAVIWSDTTNIYLASSQSGARAGGFTWLANVPLVISACDEVWVAAVTGTTTVHVYSEVWAP